MVDVNEYIAAGYFLSRHTNRRDCTGIELRRVTLAGEHSQRSWFPDAWTISWAGEDRQERLARAAEFGIADDELDDVVAWADASFGREYGAWSVFFSLAGAREAARKMLRNAVDLELWGVGLHRSLVNGWCATSGPPATQPGFAPMGAGGIHVAACQRPAVIARGGEPLGHEILIAGFGSLLDSPESRHLDETAAFRAAGVQTNSHGLIDRLEDAMACCRYLDDHAAETQHRITGWLPWLIVSYAPA